MTRADGARLPSEVTLAQGALMMGVVRSTAYRRLRPHLRWAMHSGRKVRVVAMRHVLGAVVREKESQLAIPEIEKFAGRLAAFQLIQERQAEWISKASKRLGIPV